MSSKHDHVLYGGSVIDSLENARSFGEFCYNRIKSNGDAVIYINGATSEKGPASQLLSRSIRVAECLQNYGIRAGDCVGICSENRFEVPYVMFAVLFIGATYVPLNATYSERELLHVCSFSRPKIIFASYQTITNIKKVRDQTNFTEKVFVFGDEIVGNDFGYYNVFIRNTLVPSTDNFVCPPQNVMENIALVFCSSGTTGQPKGVQLTQYNVWFSIVNEMMNIQPDECYLSVTPWTHIFGCYSLVRVAIHHRLSVYLPKFDERKYLRCIEGDNISCGTPTNGMSEGGTFCVQNNNHCKPGSVGVLRTGVYGRVIDTEAGEVLGPYSTGELVFKSPGIMKIYIGDSDATKASYDNKGWFHTGDVGYFDENEEWFIVDRLKELIKYKGSQVPPAELEALILTHPNVKDVGVIGLPDEFAGELPMAFVVKHGDCNEKDIIDYVAKRTSSPKRLRGGVKFIMEIPKNPTGKILRRVLRDMIRNQKSKL